MYVQNFYIRQSSYEYMLQPRDQDPLDGTAIDTLPFQVLHEN